MKKIILINVLLFVCGLAYSQNTVTGTFAGLANQQINLIGWQGFDTYTIDSVKANEKGVFNLSYDKKDFGMGYLAAEDNMPLFIVLGGETIKLIGEAFVLLETIKILEGAENQFFEQYASEHPQREQALGAWEYLEKIYRSDPLFSDKQTPLNVIVQEMHRIQAEDKDFLAGLNPETYVSWYLPFRKLVSSVSPIAQYRTEEIPATIAAFRNMDYADPRLYKSGLLVDVIESHFWLIENSGRPLDSMYIEMRISIDSMVENLLADNQKLNEITEYLFNLLEQRCLFEASEYLAIKLLNEQGCTLNNDFSAQLESYRVMKMGNSAPDFDFKSDYLAPGYAPAEMPKKLSEIQIKYTVIVFGASWCPQCPEELSNIVRLYDKWKEHGVEVVFVSLDEDEKTFKSFAGVFPFISICDYQKWDSPVVKDYHVFATPTMYLLDDKREILLRPNSVNHLDSWVDWFLVQGNK